MSELSKKVTRVRQVLIANTSLNVSILCLGGAGLGTRTPPDEVGRLLDVFTDIGGNFVDTAHVYPARVPGASGASERAIGAWLRRSSRRDGMVVMTKGGHPNPGAMGVPRLTRSAIHDDLHESLDRLGMESVHIYLLHRDDPNREVAELIDTLADAWRAGKVQNYGVSNWSEARIREAQEYTRIQGLPPLVVSQVGWSLAVPCRDVVLASTMRWMDPATYAMHADTGLFMAAFSPQAGGFFAKAQLPEGCSTSCAVDRICRTFCNAQNLQRLERARRLTHKYGVSTNTIALAYLLNQPLPLSAIIGCGTLNHLHDSVNATNVNLCCEDIRWLAGE
jgi:aryl-alcohol dehydrogenase-like predicted oxidoreductase